MSAEVDELFEAPEENIRKRRLNEILDRLKAISNVDPRQMFDAAGMMVSPKEWSDEFSKAVKQVKQANAGGYDVTFHDSNRAVDQLAKYEGLFDEKNETETPLDAMFAKIPRAELVKLKTLLDTMAEAESHVADDAA